jgi:hypothetical protein
VAKSAAQRALAEQEAQHEELLQAAWESQRESVAAAVAAELAPARAALAAEAERELAAQSAFARDAARRLAQSLAAQARAEYSAHLEPALRQLEAQRASHAVVAPHLAALRAQCVQALLALRAGREPSVDLRPLVAPFPLLAEAARSGARQDVGVQVAKLQPVGRFGTPGRAWVQIALVPETAWANKATAVGLGRAAPNQDPYVPPPTIPNQYTLWERFLQKLPLIGIVCGVLFALALTLVLTASLYIGKVG